MLIFLSIFIAIIIFLFFYIKAEIGKYPDANRIEQFKKLPYFRNNHFVNIYKPIDGYKNSNIREDMQKCSRIKILMRLLFPTTNHEIRKAYLNKKSFTDITNKSAVYWFGHAMVLMELSGKRILIDPVFGRASPVPFMVNRYTSAPIKRNELPKIDYVLITHNHYDHLERATVKYLYKKQNVHFIVPLGVLDTLIGWGVKPGNITELGWEDDVKLDDKIKITAEPAIHFSGRWLTHQGTSLWNSYVIQNDMDNIFCAGDGTYGEHIDMIAKKYKTFTLAMIECDAWNIRWPYFHTFTRESVEMIKKLNADFLLPVHWGIFNLGMHEFYTSIQMLQNEMMDGGLKHKLLLPAMGERIILSQN